MIRNGASRHRRIHGLRRGSVRFTFEVMERRELLSTFVVTNTTDSPTP
jgi:hypothetical protein